MDEFDSFESLGNFITKVNEDDILYNQFLEHKILKNLTNRNLENYLLDDHPFPAFECFVCEKVYQKEFRLIEQNIYDCPLPKKFTIGNTWIQHWKIGECQAKSLANLLSIGKPFSAEEYDKSWIELLQMGRC